MRNTFEMTKLFSFCWNGKKIALVTGCLLVTAGTLSPVYADSSTESVNAPIAKEYSPLEPAPIPSKRHISFSEADWYIGLRGGFSYLNPTPVRSISSNGWIGGELNVGYKLFSPHFSLGGLGGYYKLSSSDYLALGEVESTFFLSERNRGLAFSLGAGYGARASNQAGFVLSPRLMYHFPITTAFTIGLEVGAHYLIAPPPVVVFTGMLALQLWL